VTILVNGVASRTFTETGHQTHTLQVADDHATYAVSLQVCNEFSRCSTTGGTQSVQAYGPLRSSTITATPNPDGPNLTWSISGDGNGRPVDVTLTRGNGDDQVWHLTDGQTFAVTSDPLDVGYDRNETVRITLSDPQVDRNRPFVRPTGRSAAPPTATVAVSKGQACDAGSCPADGPIHACHDTNCALVVLTVGNAVTEDGDFSAGQLDCQLSAPDRSFGNQTFHVGNGSTQIDAYYSGTGTLTASCRNDTGDAGQSASGSVDWSID
jgi:hypothetical protein